MIIHCLDSIKEAVSNNLLEGLPINKALLEKLSNTKYIANTTMDSLINQFIKCSSTTIENESNVSLLRAVEIYNRPFTDW